VIVKHTYTRDRVAAKAAVRYYQLRPRGRDEDHRSIFTRDGTISRAEADKMLREHQNGNFLVHRITLSPSDREQPEDLQDLARYVLAKLEKENDQRLHWFAVEHRNTDHHHVHVMIAGTGERESDGVTRGVKLTKEDYGSMREDGREYCRMMNRVAERWDEELDLEQYRSGGITPSDDEEDEELKRRRHRLSVRTRRENYDR